MSPIDDIVVTIENVRRLKRATLVLPLGSRTVLIGTNNSGKSTLLEIVNSALRSVIPDQNQVISGSFYRREGDNLARPLIELLLPIPEALSNGEHLTEHAGVLSVGLIGSHSEPLMRSSGMASNFRLLHTSLQFRQDAKSRDLLRAKQGYLTHSTLNTNLGYLEAVRSIRADNNWLPLDTDRSQAESDATIDALASWLSPLSRALRAFAGRVFSLRAARDPRFPPSNVEARLSQSDILNATPVLKWLFFRQRYWPEIQAAFSMVFDEVDHFYFEDSGGSSEPFAALRDGFKLPIADLGFGLRNVLHILTVLFAAPERSIVLIDEPEQGLNQQKQRDFALVLESIRPDLTLLCATQAEAFCRGLSKTSVYLAELTGNITSLTHIDVTMRDGLRRIAKGMGINPLYLYEGGRILFVEGPSDRIVMEHWLRLNFGDIGDNIEVQELGGCGKIGEEFARPMFVNFKEKLFFLLDSDGESLDSPVGPGIQERERWFKKHSIDQYTILARRELENYIGTDAIASAANIHPDRIRPTAGFERFHDFKRAVKNALGYYDERKLTVGAYSKLSVDRQRLLFDNENERLVSRLREFIRN